MNGVVGIKDEEARHFLLLGVVSMALRGEAFVRRCLRFGVEIWKDRRRQCGDRLELTWQVLFHRRVSFLFQSPTFIVIVVIMSSGKEGFLVSELRLIHDLAASAKLTIS